ncbi:metalloregulator ArsR/SmtB family transcription factor [Massilia sp. W12]|uniref:metalloregulator ArsR/SmtB family transcription factor n=1 Tax=Massilia sp. W12 TaxID=3126507 RepID=UPI0030D148C3
MEALRDIDGMRTAAELACSHLRLLSHADRLMLLCQLSQGERSVSELESLLDIHQPTLSQQLGVLRNEGLVSVRRDGKRMIYALAEPRVLKLMSLLYEMYCPQPACQPPAA